MKMRFDFAALALVASVVWACGADRATAPPVPVASVTLSQDAATLVPAATVTLVATPRDASGAALQRAVVWASSDESKATVSAAGVVTGRGVGQARITATSEGRSASVEVSVKDGAVLGSAGGTASGRDGIVTLTVPPGAVSTDVMFTIETAPSPPADARLVPATAVELGPTGRTFAAPVRVQLRYDAARLPAGPPERLLTLQRAAAGGWQPLPASRVDVAAKTVEADLGSFSTYGILTAPFVAGVSLSTLSAEIAVGSSLHLAATPLDAQGIALSGRDVAWSSSDPSRATVSAIGVVTAVAPGGPVTITATVEGKSASTAITVTAQPAIALSPAAVNFSATAGGANPAAQTVDVTNAGGGTLGEMFVTVGYDAGQPAGWLTATLSAATAPAVLTLEAKAAGLAPGTYIAAATVSSRVPGVEGAAVTVSFVVRAPPVPPAIGLSLTTITLRSQSGSGTPSPQAISITNKGEGTLSDLSASVGYGAGQPGDWLKATLSTPTAPAVLTLQPATTSLAAGTYTATVSVSSPGASNSPQHVAVTYTVAPPATHLVLARPPAGAASGAPFTTQPVVEVRDAAGALVTEWTSAVTAAVTRGSGILRGTSSVNAVGGIATFNDLGIDGAGEYMLTFSSGSLTPAVSPTFSVVTVFAGVAGVAPGGLHTCAVSTESAAYCWGSNGGGQLGVGIVPDALPERWTPARVTGGLAFAALTSGENFTCGLTASGAAYCWGHPDWALGCGAPSDSLAVPRRVCVNGSRSPEPVDGGVVFAKLDAGLFGLCGVTPAGDAYCWGGGGAALGDGSDGLEKVRYPPVAVAGGLVFQSVAVGDYHNCGLTRQGEAYCWGYNRANQFGDGGTEILRSTPGPVAGGLRFTSLAAGGYHTCGVTTSGAAYCWGSNRSGQLGNPAAGLRAPSPVPVVGGLTFSTLAAAGDVTCGVTTIGAAYCWGDNSGGQLGDGTGKFGASRPTPVAVLGGLVFRGLETAVGHTCGWTTAGTLYCWGLNMEGRLGDGTTTNRSVPTPVVAP